MMEKDNKIEQNIKSRFAKKEEKQEKKEEKLSKEEIISLINIAKESLKKSNTKDSKKQLDDIKKVELATKAKFFKQKISLKDLSMFVSQWGIMMEAGLDLKKALFILFTQTENIRLKQIVDHIYVVVSGGGTISKALRDYEKELGNYFIGIIEAGEKSGLLAENLKQLANSLERQAKIQAKVKSALTYPIMVITFAVLLAFGIFQFVLPNIFAVLKDMNVNLPIITVILMGLTDFMRTPYFYILFLGTIIGGYLFYNNFSKTKRGKEVLDIIKMKLPIFGPIIKSYLVVNFFNTLSSLLATGTPMLKALEITKQVIDNSIFNRIIDYSIIKISEGKTLSDIFFKFVKGQYNPNTTILNEEDKLIISIIRDLFDPMARQMISIGDETGKIEEVLKKYADFTEEQLNRTVESISSVIEPLMIVFIGGFVAVILLAVMVPLYSVIGAGEQ